MGEKKFFTIKEYAEKNHKSAQAVYGQIKRKENAALLKEHIFFRKINNKKVKVLDEEAIKILDEASRQTPSVVMQKDTSEELDQLKIENRNLLIKVGELQEILLKEKDQVKQLQQEKIEFLEVKNKKKGWFFNRGN